MADHPWRVLVLAGLPVLLLGMEANRLKLELPHNDWLPSTTESARAIHDLRAMRRGGVVDTVRLVLLMPAGESVLDEQGWAALGWLSRRLAEDPRIERVQSPRSDLNFEGANILCAVQGLPLEVCHVDCVVVDDADGADAGCG